MIKKIKSSLSEKILFTFLISLAVFTFGSFYLIKNKCLFVKKLDLDELKISDPKNLAIMDLECGKVAIELYPQVSPISVERFKYFINSIIELFSVFIFTVCNFDSFNPVNVSIKVPSSISSFTISNPNLR